MEASTWIALGSFLLSGIAVWRAETSSRLSRRIQGAQVERIEQEERAQAEARLSVSVENRPQSSVYALVVSNVGGAPAREVVLDLEDDARAMLPHGERTSFPSIAPRERRAVLLAATMGRPNVFRVHLTWIQPNGHAAERQRIIDLTAESA